jgi:hypothetical protein
MNEACIKVNSDTGPLPCQGQEISSNAAAKIGETFV